MNEENPGMAAVDAYIAEFPEEIQNRLLEIRRIVQEEVPEAGEKIGYGMPTFTLNGNLVHFAAHQKHIGFYPTPSGIEAFAEELSRYKKAKGSVQFPYDEPLPTELIKQIVQLRVEENRAAKEAKALKKRRTDS